jgi:hypothetical protein
MTPYRKPPEPPLEPLTDAERERLDARARRRRTIALAFGVPGALIGIALVVGLLVDASSASSSRAPDSAPGASASATPADPEAHPRARPPAWGTVEDLSEEQRLPYDETWARLESGREPATWCVVGNRAGPCNRIETGTCGTRRYVKVAVDPVCGGSTSYFDETGKMVGVAATWPTHDRAPDGAFHDPLFERTYGHVPDCELVPTASLCVPPRQ